ncbi:MAG: hypothetical protein JXR97_06050, partial [Planctomycetes bacterium]|nr:hypothetical protein [Planctomycetota bacterium]
CEGGEPMIDYVSLGEALEKYGGTAVITAGDVFYCTQTAPRVEQSFWGDAVLSMPPYWDVFLHDDYLFRMHEKQPGWCSAFGRKPELPPVPFERVIKDRAKPRTIQRQRGYFVFVN